MATQGSNIWYELLTGDVEGAKGFYSEAIGWRTQSWKDGDPKHPYAMWMIGERPIGGVTKLPEDLAQRGVPPHWIAYTAVDDVDATAAKVKTLGGKLLSSPTNVPKVGRVAMVADPQGATFAIFKPEGDVAPVDNKGAGDMGWAELNTTDYEGAWNFYRELFGWEHRSTMDMGADGAYFMFHDKSGSTMGGMCNVAAKMGTPPSWLYYITVNDINAATRRIQNNRGKVLNGPMDVPGGDMIAQCQDPQGAMFAIYAEGAKA